MMKTKHSAEQTSLFDFQDQEKIVPDQTFQSSDFYSVTEHLMIIRQGPDGTVERVHMKPEEIFDPGVYSVFCGTSYSVDVSFIEKYFKSYNSFRLIVGIPETSAQEKAAELCNRIHAGNVRVDVLQSHIDDFEQFQEEEKDKIVNDEWTFSYAVDQAIHSKFYLLQSSDGCHTRLVIGSANLSTQAFDNRRPQFEDILIYDDDPKRFEFFMNRFENELIPVTSPYFTKNLKKHLKKEKVRIMPSDDKNAIPVKFDENSEIEVYAPMTQNMQEAIVQEDMVDVLEESNKHMQIGMLPDGMAQAKQNAVPPNTNLKVEKEARDIAYRLIKESVSPNKKAAPVSHATLEKTVRNVIWKNIHVKHNEALDVYEKFKQPVLLDQPAQRIFNDNVIRTGLFEEGVNDKLVPYGKKLDHDGICQGIDAVDQLIGSYQKYADNCDNHYLQRIYEAILYTFTGPFLWEIRGKIAPDGDSTIGLDVPNFMILGAASGSGKSSLLTCLDKLTRVGNSYGKGPILMSDLITMLGFKGKAESIRFLKSLVNGENNGSVRPVFIDEMAPDMFSGRQYIRSLVLDTANARACGEPMTPLIITSNAKDLSLDQEVNRRSYFLTFDHVINRSKEGEEELKRVKSACTSELFQDFCYRMAGILSDSSVVWQQYVHDDVKNSSRLDFLFHTREIFREYYAEAGKAVPEYFPNILCQDYSSLGIMKWRNLYLGSQDKFVLKKIDGKKVLFLNMNDIFSNISRNAEKNGDTAPAFAKLLPDYVRWHRKGEGSSYDDVTVALEAEAFYSWAGINKKDRKKNRLFRRS